VRAAGSPRDSTHRPARLQAVRSSGEGAGALVGGHEQLTSMGNAELLIGGLLVAIAGLGALARWLSIPYPIVLVLGGALFGFIPGIPAVKLDPNIVLVVFLPILL